MCFNKVNKRCRREFILNGFAFPYYYQIPSKILYFLDMSFVACNIPLKLCLPKISI